jgi:hypothetical protein
VVNFAASSRIERRESVAKSRTTSQNNWWSPSERPVEYTTSRWRFWVFNLDPAFTQNAVDIWQRAQDQDITLARGWCAPHGNRYHGF